MGMRCLILLTAVHTAGTGLLLAATPGLAAEAVSGETGAGLVLVASWAAVALGARTALAVVLTLLWHVLRIGGTSAAPLRAAALRVAPRAARTALTAALGGSLAAVVLTGPAVAASPTPAWPLAPAASSSPDPAWPLSEPPPAPPEDPEEELPEPRSESSSQHHVVVEGESLWQIAAQQHPDASAASLARAVEELSAANRSLIGADANLILPGQRLVLP